MAIDPTTSGSATGPAGTQVQRDSGSLDKDSFLKILVGELQNMDPMSSSNQDPTQTVSQMTQYSILEQLTNLSGSSSDTLAAQKQTQALSLLGKTVGYTDSTGADASGLVKKVDFGADGSTELTLDSGIQITPGDVLGVS
ncbi:MAG TPA: flagellar hook capping FlgD N-terminal domain-containing protein [Thermoleophilaceae bacterium]|jgi:flagellar basal-body rod modification protein FlgD